MVAVQAGLIGPQADGVTPQQNPLDVERHMFWANQGGRSGIIKGLVPSVVAGQMQLSFTAGAAVVCERDGAQVELDRAYPLYSPSTAVVQFGAASAAARNDAVVAAVVDVEDGAQGTGAIGVGGHLVVVPGVSGVTAVRTDAQIAAYLGRGGFHRLYDVPIAIGATQINLAGATFAGFKIAEWNSLVFSGAAGFTFVNCRYVIVGRNLVVMRGEFTKTGSTLTSSSQGNITDTTMAAAGSIPAAIRPLTETSYGTVWIGPGIANGTMRVDPSGTIAITDFYPTYPLAAGDTIRWDIVYPIAA